MLDEHGRYSDSSDINLNFGIATSVTDNIVQHADRLIVRERINNKQIDGNIFNNVINDMIKISAGLCFKNGEVRLGKPLLDGLLNRKRIAEELVTEKACNKKRRR